MDPKGEPFDNRALFYNTATSVLYFLHRDFILYFSNFHLLFVLFGIVHFLS